jgi:hypothetical protein
MLFRMSLQSPSEANVEEFVAETLSFGGFSTAITTVIEVSADNC